MNAFLNKLLPTKASKVVALICFPLIVLLTLIEVIGWGTANDFQTTSVILLIVDVALCALIVVGLITNKEKACEAGLTVLMSFNGIYLLLKGASSDFSTAFQIHGAYGTSLLLLLIIGIFMIGVLACYILDYFFGFKVVRPYVKLALLIMAVFAFIEWICMIVFVAWAAQMGGALWPMIFEPLIQIVLFVGLFALYQRKEA